MAVLTGHVDVFAVQFEDGQIVIEFCRGPASGGVAGTAIFAITPHVRVFGRMAGIAVLRGGFEVRHDTGIDVTLCAHHLGMLPGQGESCLVMVEIVSKAIQPIVAVHAVVAEIQGMGLHKSRVHLDVTGGADSLVESGVNLGVAIFATKRRTVGFVLVAGQQKTKRVMREAGITEVD